MVGLAKFILPLCDDRSSRPIACLTARWFSHPSGWERTGMSGVGGASQSGEDGAQVKSAVEQVLGLREVAMRVLGEAEDRDLTYRGQASIADTLKCPHSSESMNLQVSKWGNSLAMRLPAEVVRHFGLRKGDAVEAELTIDGSLTIRPAGWSRRVFAAELGAARAALPVGSSVMDELRRSARY